MMVKEKELANREKSTESLRKESYKSSAHKERCRLCVLRSARETDQEQLLQQIVGLARMKLTVNLLVMW